METYETLTQAIHALKAQGYTLNFNLKFDQLICQENNTCLNPSQFEIVKTFRFDGATSPDDEDVLYAVEGNNGELKGLLTTGYGANFDGFSPVMLEKLRYKPNTKLL